MAFSGSVMAPGVRVRTETGALGIAAWTKHTAFVAAGAIVLLIMFGLKRMSVGMRCALRGPLEPCAPHP